MLFAFSVDLGRDQGMNVPYCPIVIHFAGIRLDKYEYNH